MLYSVRYVFVADAMFDSQLTYARTFTEPKLLLRYLWSKQRWAIRILDLWEHEQPLHPGGRLYPDANHAGEGELPRLPA